MKPSKYHPIGTWVAVNAIAQVRSLDSAKPEFRRVAEWPLEIPLYGQVVGVTYLYGGRKVRGCGSYDDYGQGYLTDRHAVLVYQVRLGIRSKPIHVAPESLELVTDGVHRVLPFVGPSEASLKYRPIDAKPREVLRPVPA